MQEGHGSQTVVLNEVGEPLDDALEGVVVLIAKPTHPVKQLHVGNPEINILLELPYELLDIVSAECASGDFQEDLL